MPDAPELRVHDPHSRSREHPENQEVLARNWMKEWANLDESLTNTCEVRYPVLVDVLILQWQRELCLNFAMASPDES